MPTVQYKHSNTHEAFEDKVFQAYFIAHVTKDMKLKECLNKAELCKHDATGTDYEREEISAAWFGWCLSRDHMEAAP